MLVLGIETSCDETGLALYEDKLGLLGHVLHSQVALHNDYGGVVPELASRDHIRRCLPLLEQLLQQTGRTACTIEAIAYTQGPGLAGALLVGASIAKGLAFALGIPCIGVHHMEGHLLSPLLAAPQPNFPFVALLVSGGHTQLLEVSGIGRYRLLGDTLDDAAGEAFDKSAKLLGLPYPGGPALAKLAESGDHRRFPLPRPMLRSGDFDFSFSGLKTAVLTVTKQHELGDRGRADLAASVQEAIAEVLTSKAIDAAKYCNARRLVVAGGVGANHRLRALLVEQTRRDGIEVFFPPLEFCTDNGAMIAFVGALRLSRPAANSTEAGSDLVFGVKPRWALPSRPLA